MNYIHAQYIIYMYPTLEVYPCVSVIEQCWLVQVYHRVTDLWQRTFILLKLDAYYMQTLDVSNTWRSPGAWDTGAVSQGETCM